MKKNYKQIQHIAKYISTYGGNVDFWDFLQFSQKSLRYMLLARFNKSTRSGCFFNDNKTTNKNNKDMSKKEKLYNRLEQFIPLIGGGEFRWHFKHLLDQT